MSVTSIDPSPEGTLPVIRGPVGIEARLEGRCLSRHYRVPGRGAIDVAERFGKDKHEPHGDDADADQQRVQAPRPKGPLVLIFG